MPLDFKLLFFAWVWYCNFPPLPPGRYNIKLSWSWQEVYWRKKSHLFLLPMCLFLFAPACKRTVSFSSAPAVSFPPHRRPEFLQCTCWLPCSFLMSLMGTPLGSPDFNNIPYKCFPTGFLASPASVPDGFLRSSKQLPPQPAYWWISSVLQQTVPCLPTLTHQLWTRSVPRLRRHLLREVWIPELGNIPLFHVCSLFECSPSGCYSLKFSFISS